VWSPPDLWILPSEKLPMERKRTNWSERIACTRTHLFLYTSRERVLPTKGTMHVCTHVTVQHRKKNDEANITYT